jgi:hypothetical protein
VCHLEKRERDNKCVAVVVETSDGTRECLPVPEESGEELPDLSEADLGFTGPEGEAQEARQAELKKMAGFEVYTPVLAAEVPSDGFWTTLWRVDTKKPTGEREVEVGGSGVPWLGVV